MRLLLATLLLPVLLPPGHCAPGEPGVLDDRRRPKTPPRSPRIEKGAEDVPAAQPPPRDKRASENRVEIGFPRPMTQPELKDLLRTIAPRREDALYRAALECAEKAARLSGGSVQRVLCGRVRDGTCVWWCCEDTDRGAEDCELLYCDAKPAGDAASPERAAPR